MVAAASWSEWLNGLQTPKFDGVPRLGPALRGSCSKRGDWPHQPLEARAEVTACKRVVEVDFGAAAVGRPDNRGMSLVQTCVAVQAAIARARSLFGPTVGVGDSQTSTLIADAVQLARAGRDRTVEMAGGSRLPSYRDMVDRLIPPLMTASTSDAGLTAQVVDAAAVTKAGGERLDAIAAQTRATTQAAAGARTPAAQRAILAALRGQLQQVSDVVQTTQQQGGATAAQIRSLRYPKEAPGVPPLPNDSPGDIWDPSTAYKLFNSMNECEAWITFRRVLYPWQQWECHLAGPGGVAGSFIVDKA